MLYCGWLVSFFLKKKYKNMINLRESDREKEKANRESI
jgi:hypothetical protein